MLGSMGKWGLWILLLYAAGCGTADNRVDPGDLELRDLLGIAPQPASQWSAEQRAAARRVIGESLDHDVEVQGASLALAPFRDEAARDVVVAQALARWDDRLAREGVAAHALLRVAVTAGTARATVRASAASAAGARAQEAAAGIELQLAPAWADEPLVELTSRGADELTALARDAGHTRGAVLAVPSARLTVLAAYLESSGGATPRLLVNPVLLAALEPGDGAGAVLAGENGGDTAGSEDGAAVRGADHGSGAGGGGAPASASSVAAVPGADAIGGNPYSFYGSVAECAYAQRLRCERCLSDASCEPITDTSDGNAECATLAENDGRGYFLQCINLSLAITSVNECAAEGVPGCARSGGAANSLSTLAANQNFLDEELCQGGLDRCLAKIYGEPDGDYPTPGGGGGSGSPPRDVDVDCGNSCDSDNNNGNCEVSPSCEGPSCNNSFSCDSTCSSSNDQSSGCSSDGDGGSGGCGSCSDDSGGGNGDSSCNSDGGSGGDGCGGGGGGGDSCGSCDSSGSGSSSSDCGGDGCGGGSGSGDSCGGDGGCGGGSGDSGCSGGGGGGCSGGGGDSNKCSVATRARPGSDGGPPAALSFLVMGLWGLAPIPAVLFARRRAGRRAPPNGEATDGSADEPDDAAAVTEEEAR